MTFAKRKLSLRLQIEHALAQVKAGESFTPAQLSEYLTKQIMEKNASTVRAAYEQGREDEKLRSDLNNQARNRISNPLTQGILYAKEEGWLP